jgi:hypothetical protein
MMPIVYALLSFVVSVFRSRIALRVEIVARRHQLALYHRSVQLPPIHPADRAFWGVLSANMIAHTSRGAFVQTVLVVEPAKYRSRDDVHVLREVMAGNRGDGQPGPWLRKARAETAVRPAPIVMELPGAKDPTQVLFAHGNQVIQALAA